MATYPSVWRKFENFHERPAPKALYAVAADVVHMSLRWGSVPTSVCGMMVPVRAPPVPWQLAQLAAKTVAP